MKEHAIPKAPNSFGLNQVFQVFGHTRLNLRQAAMVAFDNLAMIDSQQCFMIDESLDEKIMTLKDYMDTTFTSLEELLPS